MSELIAEARVLVTPDTTAFRTALTTELAAATKGVTVPVAITPVATGGGAAVAAANVTKEAAAANAAVTKLVQAETVLAAADQKVVIASTQASAARSQFTAATRAATLTELAYEKALKSGDEEVIERAATERTLTRERQKSALATLRAAQATAAETAALRSSTAGQAGELAGARASQQATQRLVTTSTAAASAKVALARATDVVALAERRALAATTATSAAQTRYGATITATAATFRAYNLALETNDLLLVKQTRDAYAAAKGNEALALATLNAARAEATKTAALSKGAAAQSASLKGVTTGAGSAAASLFGLRGATLAASAPFLAGAAGAIALSKAIRLATSFNSEIAVLGATVGVTGEQLTVAADAAREFGRDITLPGVTAGDAAKTITEFSKAGLDLNDSIAATRGGLQLAQAAQLSYTDAVTLTANALNAFGLSGNQAVKVADTLANAANLAQGGIEDTALALRQAAGAAAVVGVSFEDTVALLTLLAKNGLTGSDAGTALRTAFLRLVNPSKQANKIIDSLNINLRDMQGNVRPEVFAEFAAAQRDLSVATQQANAAIVFGQDAFRAFGFLAQEGTQGLTDVQAGLRQTGTAARIAQARMTGLAGAQENLSNQLSALGETIGQVAIPPLTFFVNELARFVAAGNEAVGAAQGIAVAFKDLGADIGGAIPGGGFLGGLLGDTAVQVFKTGNLVGQAIRVRDLIGDGNDEIEDEIRNGGVAVRDAIEDAGREAARGAVSFEDQIVGAVDKAFAAIRAALAQRTRELRSAQIAAVGRGAGQQAGLEEVFNQIVAGGGSLQQQIAALERQAKVQANIIRNAGPNAAGVLLEARREAQAKLASINSQIVGLEGQIAADQKRALDEARRIREDAARERDRSFLQVQEDARSRQERLISLAEDTPALRDDIRRQEGLRTLIQRQIVALKQSAVDEKTKQAAVRALTSARDATTDELKRLRVANRLLREQERQDALDQVTENLALRTQIAEARDAGTSAIVRRIDAQISDARKAQARAKKGTTEWLEATLALEELRKKRRELLKTASDAAEDRFTGFEALQKAQGFAANLLGNLIPGFATSGLVGNISQAPITDPGLGFAAEVPTANQLSAANARGVRPVQVDTTNSLLRQILAALNGRHTTPPEIRQNRYTSAASMDTLGGV